jgi:aspartyl-tRNA(Asn)/glutamyl-tRNA(Gln) amidotransferase subunit A
LRFVRACSTISAQRKLLGDSMISARDRLDALLPRLDEPRAAKVFTKVYVEEARAAADAADARRRAGISLGALDGALVSIKDLFDVAGERTHAGSKILRDAAPAQADATIVRRLRRAGAVIFAKSAMVEFAFSGLGLNPHDGTPGNAADPARVPGGSSSGAGVAAGLGLGDIAIGSDTGGSVRIPAAFNGAVGFKPSVQRVPRDGAFPLSYTLDSIGPLASTVQRCADADAVMAGEEPAPLPRTSLSSLRVGVPRGAIFENTDAVVAEAFERALEALARAGAHVAEFAIDDLLAAMRDATAAGPIAAVEAAAVHAEWLHTRAADFDPRVHSRIARGGTVSAPDYIRSLRRRNELVGVMDARLVDIGVLAMPTVAVVPPRIDALDDDDAYGRTNMLVLRNTMVGNLFDLTGITLPISGTPLPVGLMLLARNGHDRRLLAIAAAAEAHLR